tara:strand:- start:373 stop:885 length:513 start_codon:yes stop_codon:yes gene_type:complete
VGFKTFGLKGLIHFKNPLSNRRYYNKVFKGLFVEILMGDETKTKLVYESNSIISVNLYDDSGINYKVVICGPENIFYDSSFALIEMSPSQGNFIDYIANSIMSVFSGSEIKREDLNEYALPKDSLERSFRAISLEKLINHEAVNDFIDKFPKKIGGKILSFESFEVTDTN